MWVCVFVRRFCLSGIMKILKIAGVMLTALHEMKLFIMTLRMALLAAAGMLTKAEPLFLAGTCGVAGIPLV